MFSFINIQCIMLFHRNCMTTHYITLGQERVMYNYVLYNDTCLSEILASSKNDSVLLSPQL